MNKIKEIRERCGISQSELARLSGLTPSAINQAESGNRDIRLSTAISIAKALDVSVDGIAGNSNKESAMHHLQTLQENISMAKKLSQIRVIADA